MVMGLASRAEHREGPWPRLRTSGKNYEPRQGGDTALGSVRPVRWPRARDQQCVA